MENREIILNVVSRDEAARVFARRHCLTVSQVPGGSLFPLERIALGSHDGTHLDAPYHFYPTSEGRPAKCIDEVPLDWGFGDALVLDFRHKKPTEPITEYDVASELERLGRAPKAREIVMLWTGGTDGFDDDPHFAESAAGMNGGALNYLFRFGVIVMSTDSATIDMPIAIMRERFAKGDAAAYFPIHRAGRLKEWTHAEKLANMGSLPGPSGFKVMFFPIKIRRGTGAWIRAVAIEDQWLSSRQVKLVDLSLPIMNCSFEPEESRVITTHPDRSRRARAKLMGLHVDEIVHAGAMDHVETYTQAGTHVVAPSYFGATLNGKPAATVDALPLEWFYGDAVLLDFSQKRPGEGISAADLRGELERIGYQLEPADIVLIRTGAADRFEEDPAFPDLSLAVEREALDLLLDQGVRVIGCDAESLNGPIGPMVERLRAGDGEAFFPVYQAGRAREFSLIQKMDLRGLSRPHGFKVAAFPIKLEGLSAAWTRAVALVDASA